MKKVKLTTKDLAEKLQISKAWVSYQRSGKKPWSKEFEQKLEALQARMNIEQKESQENLGELTTCHF